MPETIDWPPHRRSRRRGLILLLVVAGVLLLGGGTALSYWGDALPGAAAGVVDPIFGRPLPFYLFTLPAWQLLSGWVMTLAVIVAGVALFFTVVTGGTRMLGARRDYPGAGAWRGLSVAYAVVLLALAARTYLGRFAQLFEDHTIFSGVTYTEAHITLTGALVVSAALALGAANAFVNAASSPKLRWLVAAIAPAALCYVVVGVLGWYVTSFIVKPNELVRERPFITHNIEMTRVAYALNRIAQRPFPAETTVEAADAPNNQDTIQNIRLWDWRALQDTLRQLQEIRTYYDFPDIDIDRYEIDGSTRQMMLAARELNVDKLPESSRNWINEKLIYTHGYGVTMNPVNGFTPEGLPALILSNMPAQSTIPSIKVTRPELYFGELTNTDVYVKTRQKEFNYPRGQTNSLTSYEANGRIVLGSLLRRIIIAFDRGDLAKLPFSDDVNKDIQLLMRRNVRDRSSALATFLTYDPYPSIAIGH